MLQSYHSVYEFRARDNRSIRISSHAQCGRCATHGMPDAGDISLDTYAGLAECA